MHTACELQLEEKKKTEKESLIRIQGNEAVKREMRELGFAQILVDKPFEKFKLEDGNTQAYAAINKWRHPQKGILLHGLPGRGKSHLMAAHGKRWMEAGLAVAFQTMSGLLALLRRGYDEDLFDERLQFVSSRTDILMLDDVGAEKVSEWGEEKLYMIVDTRLNSKLPLFITTNLTEKQLESRYHPRIASRLREMCTWIGVAGPDWRATKTS